MTMAGALTQRGNQPVGMYCPIERALAVISTRSAMLVLREAFYGATRFEEFASRTGLTETTTSSQLRVLMEAGLFALRPYREPGSRSRNEYVLTPAGEDLMPALFALLQWANRHDPPPYPPVMHHESCGAQVSVVAICDAGHELVADDISVSARGPFGILKPKPAN